MPNREDTIKKHLADYHQLLDNEEGRLRALAQLADDAKRKQIEARIADLQSTRGQLDQTLNAIFKEGVKAA